MNELLDKVYEVYKTEKVGYSENCKECINKFSKKGELTGPVPIYHIGEKFNTDKFKILFLGSVAYGWDEIDIRKNPEKAKRMVTKKVKDLFFNDSSNFWKAIRSVCERLYENSEEGFRRIAISNIIKCNPNLNTSETLPASVRSHCAHGKYEYVVAKMEAEVFRPQHVVALTKTNGDYIKQWNESWDCKKLIFNHPTRLKEGQSLEKYADGIANRIKNGTLDL